MTIKKNERTGKYDVAVTIKEDGVWKRRGRNGIDTIDEAKKVENELKEVSSEKENDK